MKSDELPELLVIAGEKESGTSYSFDARRYGEQVAVCAWNSEAEAKQWLEHEGQDRPCVEVPTALLLTMLLAQPVDYLIHNPTAKDAALASDAGVGSLKPGQVLPLADLESVWPTVETLARQTGMENRDLPLLRQFAKSDPHLRPLDLIEKFADTYESKADQLEHSENPEFDIAVETCAPLEGCPTCGDAEWDFESLSPNAAAATWRCGYCGKQVIVRAQGKVASTVSQRQPIPKTVQREVWRRDRGACAECGSREKIEFDHIIPLARGGTNTARNLQLLCEPCNRRKGDRPPGST